MSRQTTSVLDIRSLTGLRSVGGVLPADLVMAVVTGTDVPGLRADDYHLELGMTPKEAANRAWAVLGTAWRNYQDALAKQPDGDPCTGLTREKWLSVVLRELGFGRVPPTPAGGITADGRSFPVSHLAEGHVPVHLLGRGVSLDKRTPGLAGAAEQAPFAMVQELLNRSDGYLWAIVANGSTLRILRDSSTLIGQAFLEFDLESIFEGDLFSDFVSLFLLCQQSRFEVLDPALGPVSCWLEQWRGLAIETGARALGALRIGVHDAIEVLGTGLVSHPANAGLREVLDTKQLSVEDFRRSLLVAVYRLLFCFVAEDRDLLLDPEASSETKERYRRWFSTPRLRRLSVRRSGDHHIDLWEALKVVTGSLGREDGCAELGLVGIGGLFESGPADLDPSLALSNRALLSVVRHLCVTRPVPDGPRRVVDYRHLGAEELGGIYEGLLAYVPKYDAALRTFELVDAAGNERKKTGAYYTPTSLTEALLDSALDPLLDRAESDPDPETALISLTVCDPACGSGHFLVAAGRRIAARLASVRAGGDEPTNDELQIAMHDVVATCLYGVDLNPMAAELAKVSLWLEGMQPGRPLSLLDGHVKVGNALLGTTPALLADGIPDAAFAAIEGDDKATCSSLRKRNKAERSGQGMFGAVDTAASVAGTLATETAAIEAIVPHSLADVHVAAKRLRDLDASPEARRARLAADAWCAAFVVPKNPGCQAITQSGLDAIQQGSAPVELVEAVHDTSVRYGWFHWHLELPHIFAARDGEDPDPTTGWSGGFDCVVGNPPWERITIQEQEWFATRMPAIRDVQTASDRKKLIADLAESHPEIHRAFQADRRKADGESHFLHNSGRFPLTGRGDVNTYAVFAETDRALTAPPGRLGVIVPTNIATDSSTQHFFKDLVTSKSLVALYDFENRDRLFDIDSRVKFCLLILSGRGVSADEASFAFFAHQPEDLQREGVVFTLTPEEITLLNPNTGTCPVFRSRRDAEITLNIYRFHPVLIKKEDATGNPWGVSLMTMFHMSNDSGMFHTREDLEAHGWALDGNTFRRADDVMLPLYQGVMTDFYDHRAADVVRSETAVKRKNQPRYLTDDEKTDPFRFAMPMYWVNQNAVDARLDGNSNHGWLTGFSSITSPTNNRTMTPCPMPRAGVGHSTHLLLSMQRPFVLLAIMSSLPFDYVTRQKLGGTNMTYNYVEQFPIIHPTEFDKHLGWTGLPTLAEWIEIRVLELVYTAWDMASAARSLGDEAAPFVWEPTRRAHLRAELDGALFHLFGIDRGNVEYITSTFPIANRKDPELAGRVLDSYDQIAEAMETGRPFVSTLDPAPGFGPRHPER